MIDVAAHAMALLEVQSSEQQGRPALLAVREESSQVKRIAMKRWRPKSERRNSYARRERFSAFMLWIKDQICAASRIPGHVCSGVIEADHAGSRGMNRKCHDFECIPLCKSAHDARPGRRAPFDVFDRAAMRDWLDARIHEHQLLARTAGIITDEQYTKYKEGKEP